MHEVIFALHSGERLHGMCLANGLGAHFTQTPPEHFALTNQIAECPRHLFNRHLRIKSMLIEEGYRVDA